MAFYPYLIALKSHQKKPIPSLGRKKPAGQSFFSLTKHKALYQIIAAALLMAGALAPPPAQAKNKGPSEQTSAQKAPAGKKQKALAKPESSSATAPLASATQPTASPQTELDAKPKAPSTAVEKGATPATTAKRGLSQESSLVCKDSFKTKFHPGGVSIGIPCKTDTDYCLGYSEQIRNRCNEDGHLMRYQCDPEEAQNISFKVIECERGCEFGACNPEESKGWLSNMF